MSLEAFLSRVHAHAWAPVAIAILLWTTHALRAGQLGPLLALLPATRRPLLMAVVGQVGAILYSVGGGSPLLAAVASLLCALVGALTLPSPTRATPRRPPVSAVPSPLAAAQAHLDQEQSDAVAAPTGSGE